MGTAEAGCVLFVGAEAREFAGVQRHCHELRKLDWPLDYCRSGRLNGRRAVMIANGPGPRLAQRALDTALERERVDAIVSTGFCGGLDPEFRDGDIFVASRIEISGGAAWPVCTPRSRKPYRCGALVSVDRVIQTVEEKKKLRESGAGAVEMEAAVLVSWARKAGLPFFCVRVIMDRADEGFGVDLNRLRDQDGRFDRLRIIKEAIARPRQVAPELMRLERRCRKAALALGDFFADCEFK